MNQLGFMHLILLYAWPILLRPAPSLELHAATAETFSFSRERDAKLLSVVILEN